MHLVAIGGSDAGISAALRAREARPGAEVTVVVADAYPNFSICGIPYYVSGEVTHWRNLAHRTVADLEATGMKLRLETVVHAIESVDHELLLVAAGGPEELIAYDKLVIGTGAVSARPPIEGLSRRRTPLEPTTGCTYFTRWVTPSPSCARSRRPSRRARSSSVRATSAWRWPKASNARGLAVTQFEQLPEVLPTVDPELGALVHAELCEHGVEVLAGTTVTKVGRSPGRLAGPIASGAVGRPGRRGDA